MSYSDADIYELQIWLYLNMLSSTKFYFFCIAHQTESLLENIW